MAIVVLGGLVTSMFVNLFVAPAVYLRFGFSPRAAEPAAVEPLPRQARMAGQRLEAIAKARGGTE